MRQEPSREVSEKVVWRWLERARSDDRTVALPLHMERVENLVGEGTPDVQGILDGRYFDVELKSAGRPVHRETPVIPVAGDPQKSYIRATQKVWHEARWRSGGSNFLLVQVGRDREAARYLIPGNQVRNIEGRTEDELYGMSVLTPPKPFDYLYRASRLRHPT